MLNVCLFVSESTGLIIANALSSTPMFLIGLAFGTSLLLIGLGIGFWIGRKMVSTTVLEDSMEREQVLRFVRNFATWTKDFAGDFSQYQTQVRRLSQQVTANPEDVSTLDLQTILHQISQANQKLQARLDHAEERLENQTKELASYLTEARTDGLTGLPNRRSFDQQIDERFSRWMATKKPFCLGLIDIDFFKRINDTYGHPVGDCVLREIASHLRLLSQEGCEVARYGGEEFAVLVDLPLEAAANMIDRLRDSIQAKPVSSDSQTIKVTISCGVTVILPEERIGKLVRRADESLYAAKASGRNRVFYHDGKLCRPFGKPTLSPSSPSLVTNSPSATGPETPNGHSLQQRLQNRLDQLLSEET